LTLKNKEIDVNLNSQVAKKSLRCTDLEEEARELRQIAISAGSMAGMIRVAQLEEEAARNMDFSAVISFRSRE
jgi:hypothetical protein